jgi:hypothetical protein
MTYGDHPFLDPSQDHSYEGPPPEAYVNPNDFADDASWWAVNASTMAEAEYRARNAAQTSRRRDDWHALPTYEEYAAARQAERQAAWPVPCKECGVWAKGQCVDCHEPACSDHSRIVGGKLRCLADAAQYPERQSRREADEALWNAREAARQARLAEFHRQREDEERAEAERKSRLPILRGQQLADYLSGKTNEWDDGKLGDTDGASLAEALGLAGIPSVQRWSVGAVRGRIRRSKTSYSGWNIGKAFLLTDGRTVRATVQGDEYLPPYPHIRWESNCRIC